MNNNPMTITVSQLNRRIATLLKGDKSLIGLSVKGEISNFSVKDGHMYFSLTEKVEKETVSVKAVMFSSNAAKLQFRPEDGMSVIVLGNVQCYERYGIYQIYATSIIPYGEGARAVALKQLHKKLQTEGLFSRHRKLPEYPRKVCIITSESGAVLHDICENINPLVKLVLIPASVQGEKAPESICRALKLANDTDADLIIFGRGGGSAEDLSAFNDENVVRAVYNSRIPTISAVGHEVDRSLTDLAADESVSTPTAAAKLASPDKGKVFRIVDSELLQIKQSLTAMIGRREQEVGKTFLEVRAKSPQNRLSAQEQLFEADCAAIRAGIKRILSKKEDMFAMEAANVKDRLGRLLSDKMTSLSHIAALISEKDPMKLLAKGYSVIYKDENVISNASQLEAGDKVVIKMSGGSADAEITSVTKTEE